MILSAEEWMQRVKTKPRRKDIWNGLIPAQPAIIILAGPTGIGKTVLSNQLLLSVAAGIPCFGIPTSPAKTAYIGFE
ncbi:MAG: AAA family ATPase, partial [Candidatus Micrarchaeota archaeon]